MGKRVIIVTGGDIRDELVLPLLRDPENSIILGVDKGTEFLYRNGIKPSYIIGDFDSMDEKIANYYKQETSVPIQEHSTIKNSSDTELAIRMAMGLGGNELFILGATGGRMDHFLANIQVLSVPFKAGVTAYIMDVQNRIRLIGGDFTLKKEKAFGKYFSLFPLGDKLEDLTIRGAMYNLNGHTLSSFDSLCLSNRIVKDELQIEFSSGIGILIESNDREEFR